MKKNWNVVLLTILVFASSVLCSRLAPTGDMTATQTIEVRPTKAALEGKPTVQPQAEPNPTETKSETGTIAGILNYPSEGIPPLRVVAFRVGGEEWYSVEVNQGSQFLIENLPPGEYNVVAYLLDKSMNQTAAGGFSNFVPCGMSVECEDHSLIPVNVEAGKLTEGVLPGDWYAPEGTFPPDPAVQ